MNKYYYLGIDVSKGYADMVILDEKKRIIESNFQLDDTFAGHCEMHKILSNVFQKYKPDIIYAAVESTGGYENNWYHNLRKLQYDMNLQVARINPIGVYHSNKANLKRVTTDRTSAFSIAEYLINHSNKVIYDSTDYFVNLRRQRAFVQLLKSQKTQLLNQFQSLCYDSFPEIVRYFNSGVPDWALKLIRKHPTAAKLAKASLKSLIKIPYITEDKARELIKLAKNSVASSQGTIIEKLIRSTIDQILSKNNNIKAQVALMVAECQLPEFELLKTIPGVSDWSAMNLLIEIGSIERFSSVKKLISYFGLNPTFKQSGDGLSRVMMSKQGRIEPRRVLFMTVMSGLGNKNFIKKTYDRFCSSGMVPMAAIGVCMHKIARIIYGMLKNNTTFDENVDIKNQEKTVNKSLAVKDSKDRRYQKYDNKAPISRRQNKKRTAGDQPQNVKNINCGV